MLSTRTRRTKLPFAALVLGLGAAAIGSATGSSAQPAPEQGGDQRAVLALDERRAAAFVTGDHAFLDTVTAADYTHVETSGATKTKAELIAERRRGTPRFERFDIERNDVRIIGDVAVVTGRYVNQVRTAAGLQPAKRARHLRVYVRREGGWQVVAHQATESAS